MLKILSFLIFIIKEQLMIHRSTCLWYDRAMEKSAETIIVMGVSGSGKTTCARLLAERMDYLFIDADDEHDSMSIEQMHRGIPLDDQSRLPWLRRLASLIAEEGRTRGIVLACSALKRSYRELLGSTSSVRYIYLKGDLKTIERQLSMRTDHFFPASLLHSQFSALEEPDDAIVVDLNRAAPLSEVIEGLLAELVGNEVRGSRGGDR